MKNVLLIVNPCSGKRKGKEEAAYIQRELTTRGMACAVFISRDVREMEQFLQQCRLSDFDLLGLAGGDGTMHALLNIMLSRFEQVPLPVAFFPCGTGNAFNSDIGCATIDDTLRSIDAGRCQYIDVAEMHCGKERLWSFNILGCGLVADINRLAENLRWLGSSRYTVASLIKLLANPKTELKIKTDKALYEGRFSFVLACNTRYTGKGMMMAPRARLNDGQFDVIMVKACSAFKLLWLFPRIFKGKHLDADILIYSQTATLEVSSGHLSLPALVDGESKGSTPFLLTVHRNKISVFARDIRKAETGAVAS